jgi:hypothetical protein
MPVGSRDPHDVLGEGAGFVLCWSGQPRLRIGYENEQKELLQVEGSEMIFAIPEYVLLLHNRCSGAHASPIASSTTVVCHMSRKASRMCRIPLVHASIAKWYVYRS